MHRAGLCERVAELLVARVSATTPDRHSRRIARLLNRAALALTAIGAVLFISGIGRTEPSHVKDPAPSSQQCLEAYSGGQRARRSGELQKARRMFAFCGGVSCPSALHGDCQQWLSQVEVAIPTSVFRITRTDGTEINQVQLRVGDSEPQIITGRAMEFDPGEQELTFEAEGYLTTTRKFTFSEGAKLVVRDVVLSASHEATPNPAPAATPDNQGRTSSETKFQAQTEPNAVGVERSASLVPVWIGAGVAVAGVAGFTYFGLQARSNDKRLSACSPNCSRAEVQEVEQGYLLANISAGVGAAGLVGALLWLLLDSSDPVPAATSGRRLLPHVVVASNGASIVGEF